MNKKPQQSGIGSSGVEVIIEDLNNHPTCPHGPTLLFSQQRDNITRQYFACSACRDRKLCNFFLWAEEEDKLSKAKKNAWEQERVKFLKGINHRKLFILLNQIKALPSQKRIFCQNCSIFILQNESMHKDHKLINNISDYQLEHPSEMLEPLENSKKEAQYLFSKASTEFIVKTFHKLNYKYVICIGTPRIHEYIQANCDSMMSILLDIDRRYHSFFGPLQFCWYNSFNNHFFFKEAKHVFDDFLKSTMGQNTVLVTDPPFGGRIEPLAHTFTIIGNTYEKLNNGKEDLPIFWMFPYFMEPQMTNYLKKICMLDYKVEYDNHPLFQGGPKGRKQGSPVRIFTNVNPKLIELPNDLYTFCSVCEKWVSKENKHCNKCGKCTSKNGETYIHCDICQRCVKPHWQHCKSCNRCAQINHKCGKIGFYGSCLLCKKIGHKKIECPQAIVKRKQQSKLISVKKRKVTS